MNENARGEIRGRFCFQKLKCPSKCRLRFGEIPSTKDSLQQIGRARDGIGPDRLFFDREIVEQPV
jgi:hypothetical protein